MATIPETLKSDNWALYVLSRSHDPGLCVTYTRKFISSLITTMRIAEIKDHDELFTECALRVNKALKDLSISESSWAQSMQTAENILDDLAHFAYDEKYSKPVGDSFRHDLAARVT